MMRKKKTELLTLLQVGDKDRSALVAQELGEMTNFYKSLAFQDKQQLYSIRNQKLKVLQGVLQKNAEDEFCDFKTQFQDKKRPAQRLKMLNERIGKEEMYFDPVLNSLGQFILVRQLRQQNQQSPGPKGSSSRSQRISPTKSMKSGENVAPYEDQEQQQQSALQNIRIFEK